MCSVLRLVWQIVVSVETGGGAAKGKAAVRTAERFSECASRNGYVAAFFSNFSNIS